MSKSPSKAQIGSTNTSGIVLDNLPPEAVNKLSTFPSVEEDRHQRGWCKSSFAHVSEQRIFAFVSRADIRILEGMLLTLIDASFSDPQQRKAFKDMALQVVRERWADKLDRPFPKPVTAEEIEAGEAEGTMLVNRQDGRYNPDKYNPRNCS